MAITSQAELQVRARLAEVARAQRAADHNAWSGWAQTYSTAAPVISTPDSGQGTVIVTPEAAPAAVTVARLSPRGWGRPRWLLGAALIRLGVLIAGPALPSMPQGTPPRHA